MERGRGCEQTRLLSAHASLLLLLRTYLLLLACLLLLAGRGIQARSAEVEEGR
jgi:hypothetical protein